MITPKKTSTRKKTPAKVPDRPVQSIRLAQVDPNTDRTEDLRAALTVVKAFSARPRVSAEAQRLLERISDVLAERERRPT